MNILFINSRKFDYGQDLLFTGLNELNESCSVHSQPWRLSYYLPTQSYPKNLGYIGYKKILSSFKNISPESTDLVIVGAAKPDAFETYLSLIKRIPKSTPVYFIDGGDREELGGDLARAGAFELYQKAEDIRPFDLIFKREYLKSNKYESRVKPLPFSINIKALNMLPSPKKERDVFFWAIESHPIRKTAFQLLSQSFDQDGGVGQSQSMKSYKFKGRRYHEELSRSKIGISLRGGGWDTLRYWEVPALGAMMITTPLDIVIPNDFEDKKHVIRCQPDLSDLVELCNYYVKNDSERSKIIAAGYKHLLEHHTSQARAKYVLSFFNKGLNAK